jgi:hypothetical protein
MVSIWHWCVRELFSISTEGQLGQQDADDVVRCRRGWLRWRNSACKRSQANITNYADIAFEMLEIKLTKFVNTFKTKSIILTNKYCVFMRNPTLFIVLYIVLSYLLAMFIVLSYFIPFAMSESHGESRWLRSDSASHRELRLNRARQARLISALRLYSKWGWIIHYYTTRTRTNKNNSFCPKVNTEKRAKWRGKNLFRFYFVYTLLWLNPSNWFIFCEVSPCIFPDPCY